MNNVNRIKARCVTTNTIPSALPKGELVVNTDTNALYVGTGDGWVQVNTNESISAMKHEVDKMYVEIREKLLVITKQSEDIENMVSTSESLLEGTFKKEVLDKIHLNYQLIQEAFSRIIKLEGGTRPPYEGTLLKTEDNKLLSDEQNNKLEVD